MKRINLLFVVVVMTLAGCATYEPPPIGQVFYPDPPMLPRIQFLMTINSEDDLAIKSAWESFLLGPDQQYEGIRRSYDLATTKGKIYIVDRFYKKIFIVDLNKKTFKMFVDGQTREGKLGNPGGIWITHDEMKYIADMERQQVVVYDAYDKFVRAYGSKEIFAKPVDVAVSKNKIFVCDVQKRQVLILDKNTGKVIGSITKFADDLNMKEFSRPTHINLDHLGHVYVSDAFQGVIRKFDTEGKYIKRFGFLGDNVGGLVRPKGFDFDEDDRLYVVDAATSQIQIFDKAGQLLLYFGGVGNGPGQLYLPAGLHIDEYNVPYFQNYIHQDFEVKYLIFATNLAGFNKINVYGFGDWHGEDPSKQVPAQGK